MAACLLFGLVLPGCHAQPEVLFAATRDNGAVLGLTGTHDLCEAGSQLAYLTNELGTWRGCWVRARGEVRASFAGVPEIRIAASEFQATALAEQRSMLIESFTEGPLYATGISRQR